MYGFAQVPCPKCGTVVHVSPQVGTGVCPKCYAQTSMPAGGAPAGAAPQPYGAPGAAPGAPPGGPQAPQMGAPQMGAPQMGMAAYGARGGGKGRLFAGIGVVILAVAGSVGYSTFKSKFGPVGKDKARYSAVKLEVEKADGDKMISNVKELATKWRGDAIWWSVNYQAVRADGTVDVEKGAEVEYISPSKVTNASKKGREDSIKKFSFGPSLIDYSARWDAINKWTVYEPEMPKCSIKDLVKKLADKGLKGSKTVRITFDPSHDWGDVQAWRVIGEDPKMDTHFSMVDCAEISSLQSGGHASGDDEE
jgi:hypothetical protein